VLLLNVPIRHLRVQQGLQLLQLLSVCMRTRLVRLLVLLLLQRLVCCHLALCST
jgi:hypothetical protein